MPQNKNIAKNITSLQNPHIKKVIRLRQPRVRRQTGLMLVEGFRELLRAKEAGIFFCELFLCRDFLVSVDAQAFIPLEKIHPIRNEFLTGQAQTARPVRKLFSNGVKEHSSLTGFIKQLCSKDTDVFEVTKKIFKKISFGERQEGLLAICRQPKKGLADLKLKKNPLLVVVEEIEKPGNLGAIIRSGDAAAIDGVILCDSKTDAYNPSVIRASLGTVFSVMVVTSAPEETYQFLRKNNIKIYTASPQAKTSYTQISLNIPAAIVVGSEKAGLSDFWRQRADAQIKIPMYGRADSLNVSAATAVLLYEALRQRNNLSS